MGAIPGSLEQGLGLPVSKGDTALAPKGRSDDTAQRDIKEAVGSEV